MATTDDHVNVLTGPNGAFTESFNDQVIDVLLRMDFIELEREDHVLITSNLRGQSTNVGPIHRFYVPKKELR